MSEELLVTILKFYLRIVSPFICRKFHSVASADGEPILPDPGQSPFCGCSARAGAVKWLCYDWSDTLRAVRIGLLLGSLPFHVIIMEKTKDRFYIGQAGDLMQRLTIAVIVYDANYHLIPVPGPCGGKSRRAGKKTLRGEKNPFSGFC